MKILFINYTFPGIFALLANAFTANPENEILFASSHNRSNYSIPNVRHIRIAATHKPKGVKSNKIAATFEELWTMGTKSLHAFNLVTQRGFVPDIVLSSVSGGYTMFWEEAFPNSFKVSWSEGNNSLPKSKLSEVDIVRLFLQSNQALSSDLFVSLTLGQQSIYTKQLKAAVDLPYIVNTDFFVPSTEKVMLDDIELPTNSELVVCVIRKSTQGEQLVEMLSSLLHLRPQCHVALLCDSMQVITSFRQLCQTLAFAKQRVHILGVISLRKYRILLGQAAILLCQNLEEVPPSVILEAMSCETAVVLLEETSSPYLQHDQNLLLCPQGQSAYSEVATYLAYLLEQKSTLARVRKGARQCVLEHFSRQKIFAQYLDVLQHHYSKWKEQQS